MKIGDFVAVELPEETVYGTVKAFGLLGYVRVRLEHYDVVVAQLAVRPTELGEDALQICQ